VNADSGEIVEPEIWSVSARPVSKPIPATIFVALDPASSDRLSG
jgi:hypothetical protein